MSRYWVAGLLAAFCVGACTPEVGVQPPPPAAASLAGQATPAAGLVVTNARIIDGTGRTIESGSVVVRDGLIVSVADGAVNVPGALVVDAGGRTLMPGLIDAHRHIIQGDARAWLEGEAADRMQEFLDAGFTTVLSAGDSLDEILELRRRTAAGEIIGPRIIAAGRAQLAAAPAAEGGARVDPARTDRSRRPRTTAAAPRARDETRARVRRIAKAGVDAIKTAIIVDT